MRQWLEPPPPHGLQLSANEFELETTGKQSKTLKRQADAPPGQTLQADHATGLPAVTM